jgi:hypothetical protein
MEHASAVVEDSNVLRIRGLLLEKIGELVAVMVAHAPAECRRFAVNANQTINESFTSNANERGDLSIEGD